MRTFAKCLAAGTMALLCTSARAEGTGEGACQGDVQRLCKDVPLGEGRILECLKTHQAELSPKCTARLKELQQAVKQVSAACEPDVERFCFGTPSGKGAIAKCLKKHEAELSPDCKAAAAAAMKKKR